MLRGDNGASGYARVDYFTPKGLGAWGDVRFTILGTEGYIEVTQVGEKLLVVDRAEKRELECAGHAVAWAGEFFAGNMPIAQPHVFAVHETCLAAQRLATAS